MPTTSDEALRTLLLQWTCNKTNGREGTVQIGELQRVATDAGYPVDAADDAIEVLKSRGHLAAAGMVKVALTERGVRAAEAKVRGLS